MKNKKKNARRSFKLAKKLNKQTGGSWLAFPDSDMVFSELKFNCFYNVSILQISKKYYKMWATDSDGLDDFVSYNSSLKGLLFEFKSFLIGRMETHTNIKKLLFGEE